MANLLVKVSVDLHYSIKELGFYTDITLLGYFPRELVIRVRSDIRSCHGGPTRARVYCAFRIQQW